ncbi:2-oxo-tetronate isomerase [Leptothrix ochracea]|uniref:2-oxo-tetronate isomerase n=1 Tax=Leptothrix ochracea TaxID=735331 RepID=UPI0034E24B6C
MPKFAANLTMMYGEHPFLDRFKAAARDGFKAVEVLFPYDHAPAEIAARLREHALQLVLFNVRPGDWAAGERGLAALPGREAEFAAALDEALRYAQALACPRLHVMAGLVPKGADAHLRAQMHQTYVANLRHAVGLAAAQGVALTVEPINPRDMPGYFLTHQAQAHAIVSEVVGDNDRSTLGVQMDLYHCQIVEGDLMRRLERYHHGVTHIQIAGVPDRHEPDVGEVRFEPLFAQLDALGYSGYIGCEYRPKGATSAGLAWLRPWWA